MYVWSLVSRRKERTRFNKFDSRIFFFHDATAPSGPGPPHYRGFKIKLRHTTLGEIPLDEWAARHRDVYPTTLNTHKEQAFMHQEGFEPIIVAREQSQSHALDRSAIGIGFRTCYLLTYLLHGAESFLRS